MLKRIGIIVIVLVLLGAAGIGVWASTPLDEILSPTPEATATPVAVVVTETINVVSASGYSACEFSVKPADQGWSLHYGFETPGTTGKLVEGDIVLDKVIVGSTDYPLHRPSIVLEAGVSRKFRIEASGNGWWQYSVRPADGTVIAVTSIKQPPDENGSGPQQSFRLKACRG